MNNDQQPAGKSAGKTMMVVAWLIGMLLATKFFAAWEDNKINPNKDPQASYGEEYNEVILKSGYGGHYMVNGYINGQKVVFLLDTGATNVAVSTRLAENLNLKKGVQIELNTANGVTKGWTTTLKNTRVGTIELTDLPAIIVSNMSDEVLLGMGFLRRLEMIKQRDGQLTLRQYKSNR